MEEELDKVDDLKDNINNLKESNEGLKDSVNKNNELMKN